MKKTTKTFMAHSMVANRLQLLRYQPIKKGAKPPSVVNRQTTVYFKDYWKLLAIVPFDVAIPTVRHDRIVTFTTKANWAGLHKIGTRRCFVVEHTFATTWKAFIGYSTIITMDVRRGIGTFPICTVHCVPTW